MLWSEYLPDLCSLKVYLKDGISCNNLKVSIKGHKIVATHDNESDEVILHLPLDYVTENIIIGDAVQCYDIESVSIRLPCAVSVDFLQSVSQCLNEDWSSLASLYCRECKKPINDMVDLSSLAPCLLPSAAWGFEDMRVCEECGPLVSACHSSSKKKSKKRNFYITETDLFLDSDDCEGRQCVHCDSRIMESLTEGELQFMGQRVADSRLLENGMKIGKK